jgi:hypothetical protein
MEGDLTAEDLSNVRGGRDVYFWGWIEYDDVFIKSKRHRSEFCQLLSTSGTVPDKPGFSIASQTHSEFSGSDEDCYRQPKPRAG